MVDKLEEARRRERIQQLKALPFCIYIVVLMFLGYWVLLSDTVTISGKTLFGFSKWLWFVTVDFMFGLGMVLIIGSFSLLVWVHLVISYLRFRTNSWRLLSYSTLLLAAGYLVFFGLFKVEYYIRDNASQISSYFFEHVYRFEILELLINIFMFVGAISIAAFFTYSAVYLIVFPFKAKEYAKQLRENFIER